MCLAVYVYGNYPAHVHQWDDVGCGVTFSPYLCEVKMGGSPK